MYELPLPRPIKDFTRRLLPTSFWSALKELQRELAFNGKGPHSFDEPAIMRQIERQKDIFPFFVDIGAQDGVLGSQTLGLAKRGWAGVSYEADAGLCAGMRHRYSAFDSVRVRQAFVSPLNVCTLLSNDAVPRDFGFLNLDIDSFDYEVLDAVLDEFRPKVICVEINEMIPPPIVFRVRYNPNHSWAGDRFQGFSIQAVKFLCKKHHYAIGELHYNNLLLIATSANSVLPTDSDIARAYQTGYVQRPDRQKLFPWNAPFEQLITADPALVLDELKLLFHDHLHLCDLEISAIEN